MSLETAILADGSFPVHEIPLEYLKNAKRIICCDGSAEALVAKGFIPEAIVGDLDSLSKEISVRFKDRLFIDNNQDTNDLTKAVRWCVKRGYLDVVIIGATGKREDHTLGNISLLAEYAGMLNPIIVTDTGIFKPCLKSCRMTSFKGQQISIFSINPETEISSAGLKYPLKRLKLHNWWRATLNEATGNNFEIRFTGGPVLIYQKFRE